MVKYLYIYAYIYAKFYPIDNKPIHSSAFPGQTYFPIVNQ